MHRSLLAMLLLSLPASARRGDDNRGVELPALQAALEAAGWAMTPERSAAYQVGDIYTPDGQVVATGRECFSAQPREEVFTSYEAIQAIQAGARVPLGVARIQAKGMQYKQLTFAEPYTRDLSELAMEQGFTDDCRAFLERRARNADLSGWYVISAVLMAEVKERLCRELEVGATVYGVGGEGGVSQECVQGSEGHVAFAFKTRPVTALPLSVAVVDPAPPNPTPPDEPGTFGSSSFGSGAPGDVQERLRQQACDDAAKPAAEAQRAAALDAEEARVLSLASTAWRAKVGELEAALGLRDVADRVAEIAWVDGFLADARAAHVGIAAGVEAVQTDCGLREVAFEAERRVVVVPDIGDAEALLVRLRSPSGAAGGPADYPLVSLPGGAFTMGCTVGQSDCGSAEKPAHRVTVSTFSMGATEVTQGLWTSVMRSNPSRFDSCGDDCPVENVSWLDAVAFANAMSAREDLEACYRVSGETVTWPKGIACRGYRLPTEAEWEYAARAGEDTLYAGSNSVDEVAWYKGNSGRTTHPVGQKAANRWKIHDMSGNVWEWCWDWYGDYNSDDKADPVGASSGSFRVNRGGSWGVAPRVTRVAVRYWYAPGFRHYGSVGLRLARSSAPER